MYSDRFLQLIDPPPTEITYKLWFLDIFKNISTLELLVFLEMFMSCGGGSRIFHLSMGRGGGGWCTTREWWNWRVAYTNLESE